MQVQIARSALNGGSQQYVDGLNGKGLIDRFELGQLAKRGFSQRRDNRRIRCGNKQRVLIRCL